GLTTESDGNSSNTSLNVSTVDKKPPKEVTGTVSKVSDSNSLTLNTQEHGEVIVSFLGVEIPPRYASLDVSKYEEVPNTEAGKGCLRAWSKNANDYLEKNLVGETVRVEFQGRESSVPRKGYVYLGGGLFNLRLVREGYARALDGGYSESDSFLSWEKQAQRSRKGLWECAPGGAFEPKGRLIITEVHADAQGTDQENLNDEYIVFKNVGNAPLDMSTWVVRNQNSRTYTFPEGYVLGVDETVTLHSGSNPRFKIPENASDVYWGSLSPVLPNDGGTITVKDSQYNPVLKKEY
ncbi:MAG: lamin tail domain-containing protein, partial [Halobacteria archaeon]|nr:lamin tail domain-containing protein [Halobacteria archaeon]